LLKFYLQCYKETLTSSKVQLNTVSNLLKFIILILETNKIG
jgi:hypothetical protein